MSSHNKHPSRLRKHSKSKRQTQIVPDELALEYQNEDHIEAYGRALAEDPNVDPTEHISAMTDFMPIKQKIRMRQHVPTGFEGFTYHIIRFPLILVIFLIIGVEMLLYILVRQIVNLWEYFVQWRGERQILREKLRQSKTYDEWIQGAKNLDSHLKFDKWKDEIPFEYYDFNLLQKVSCDLENFREGPNKNPHVLKDVLQNCVKSNFAGVENVRLYSRTYYGTKKVVEKYIGGVTNSLESLRLSKALSFDEKRRLFKNAYKNYGRTALCLSGGAGFGYYHLGVVKALWSQNLLPEVITGTSAGGLIAALTCTRTDKELEQVLCPELHVRLIACSDSIPVWFNRFLETGARFDPCDWARKLQWITKGSLTFREAYERTGRILNISVIPYDPHSPSKVLNYITTPDCVIWSAVIASAAVPGLLPPTVLMKKTKDGTLVPYNYGHKWKDGSLRTDIPVQALHTHFNVKFTIVSQVNPHVHLFFFAPRGTVGRPVSHRLGRGWRGGFIAASIEQYLKLDLSKWLKVIRDLELLPKVADQDWSSIWLQRFDGNVTIWPKSTIWDWFNILADPDHERLSQMITTGQRVTWPKLHMISNRLCIERAIQKGRQTVKHKSHRQSKFGGYGQDSTGITAISRSVGKGGQSEEISGNGNDNVEVDSGNGTETEPATMALSESCSNTVTSSSSSSLSSLSSSSSSSSEGEDRGTTPEDGQKSSLSHS